MTWAILSIGFVTAIITSAYGAIVAGPGLVLIPVLVFVGIPIKQAIASAIIGYIGMSISGLTVYGKAGKTRIRDILPFTVLCVLGALVGPFILTSLIPSTVQRSIGALLLVLFILLVLQKDQSLPLQKTTHWHKNIGLLLAFPFGLYASSITLGSAIFLTYIMLYSFGQTPLESAASRKFIFAGTNVVSGIIFAMQGLIVWPLAIVLFIGSSIGSYFGSRLAIKKGDTWVKWAFAILVLISGVQLILT